MIRSILGCALLLLTCAGALGAQSPHPITLQEDLTPRTCRGGSSAGAACTSHDDCRPGGLCGPPILAEQLDDNFRALRVLFDGSVGFFDLYLPGATTCALPCTDRAVCVDTDATGAGLRICRSGVWEDTSAGGGSSIILDLGDDGTNESVALAEIATVNMPANMWTEPAADKLLVDGSVPWTTATKLDADGDGVAELDTTGAQWAMDFDDSGSVDFVAKAANPGTNSLCGTNGGACIDRDLPSCTVPSIWPSASDNGTGMGWASGSNLCLIAGGNSVVVASHNGSRGLVTIADLLQLHNAATPPATCAAGLSGSLYYDTTTPSVCVCNGSAWTPMWPTGGDCT